MTNASSNYQQLRYIAEATQGVTPGSGNAVDLRMLDPNFKASLSTIKSAEINSTRMAADSAISDMNVDGGFNFELSGKEYDPFIAASVYGAFSHYGTGGLGSTFSATTAANTITAGAAPTGGSAFTSLTQGSWFKVVPPAAASTAVKDYFADKWLKVSSSVAPTSTVITLDASTLLTGVGLGITAVAGYAISQSVVSNGSTTTSFSFEDAFTDIGQFLLYRGMQVNNFNIDLSVGSIIKGSAAFMGLTHAINSATALPGSPVASNSLPVMNAVTDVGMVLENGSNLLNSGSFIKSAKIEISNNLRGQKAIGVLGNAGIGLGELSVKGTLEVYFQDATYYNKWLNGTQTSVAIGMADNLGNGYLFEMEKVKFRDGGLNGTGKDQDVMLSLPFDAFYNATTGRGIRITRAIAS